MHYHNQNKFYKFKQSCLKAPHEESKKFYSYKQILFLKDLELWGYLLLGMYYTGTYSENTVQGKLQSY